MKYKERIFTILRNLWQEDNGLSPDHRICYNKALQDVQIAIDSMFEESEGKNLKEEIKKILEQTGVPYYWDSEEEQLEWVEIIARHFAKWQKEQMIDKACEWLKENIYQRVYKCGDELGFPTAEFLKDFRKAMEAKK